MVWPIISNAQLNLPYGRAQHGGSQNRQWLSCRIRFVTAKIRTANKERRAAGAPSAAYLCRDSRPQLSGRASLGLYLRNRPRYELLDCFRSSFTSSVPFFASVFLFALGPNVWMAFPRL